MRVIAGSAGGRRLVAPPGRTTRPTADRVREALFSSIAPHVPGAVVLDLYAGSGALGIEALSRGAAFAVFVDDARAAQRAIECNLATTRLTARARVVRADAGRFCATEGGRGPGAFDLVLADPPYAEPLPRLLGHLTALHRTGALSDGALVVIERDRRDPALDRPTPQPFAHQRDRAYGDTVLRVLRVADDEELSA